VNKKLSASGGSKRETLFQKVTSNSSPIWGRGAEGNELADAAIFEKKNKRQRVELGIGGTGPIP